MDALSATTSIMILSLFSNLVLWIAYKIVYADREDIVNENKQLLETNRKLSKFKGN